MGLLSTVMAIPQMVASTPLSTAMERLYPDPADPSRYTVMFIGLNVSCLITSFGLAAYWCCCPPPPIGAVTFDAATGTIAVATRVARGGGGGVEGGGELDGTGGVNGAEGKGGRGGDRGGDGTGRGDWDGERGQGGRLDSYL